MLKIDGIDYEFINELYNNRQDRYIVSVRKNGKYFRMPRTHYVWILNNKRNIPKGYIIHHIDKDKKNDDINNLQLVTRSEHNRLHANDKNHYMFRKGHTYWNKPKSEEHKRKIKEAHLIYNQGQREKLLIIAEKEIKINPEIGGLELANKMGRKSINIFRGLFKTNFTKFKQAILIGKYPVSR